MKSVFTLLAAAATVTVAAPVAGQNTYPYPQQTYPQQSYPAPSYSGYGYPQQGNPMAQIIEQLLGNRYNVNDRTAVQRCASAAVVQANARYRPNGYGAYGQQGYGYGQQGYGQHGYGQGYNAVNMRVTAITEVRRVRNGLRVAGLIDSRGGYPPYGQAYGYQNQAYAAGDLTFRCNVDYRGAVTNVRVNRNRGAYRR